MGKTIIIGAGISGLSAAFWIQQQGVDVEVFEKNHRAGGVIETLQEEGFLFEKGPNSFLDNAPDTMALCRDLKLENEVLKQSMRTNARFIYLNGKLQEVPIGPGGLIKTELLSGKAKRGLLKEMFRKANRSKEDESLASFIRRRLGDEILNNMVTPFISGVYAGDPEHLSLRATFPLFYELERNHGSLIRGMLFRGRRKKKEQKESSTEGAARAKNMCSLVDGMEILTQALARALGDRLHLNSPVAEIRRKPEGGYRVMIDGAQPRLAEADVLVLAVPAYNASALLEPILHQSSGYLHTIPYNALSVVGMGYSRDAVKHECNGFGFLAPRNQGVRILGSIWSSSLFVRRAPGGYKNFTVFIGGGLDPEAFALKDEELLQQIQTDLKITVGAEGKPVVRRIFRWERAIPQYPIGHVEHIEDLQREIASTPGLFCIGNYLDGVAVNDCIRNARRVAREVVNILKAHEPGIPKVAV
ncbi:MAG: protoporphyrinogen oxidase [Candidatus Omnitrophica bacterium]|nr:protoporphyrinogen oxidase [Candidatus Omnitrophota bacterium]